MMKKNINRSETAMLHTPKKILVSWLMLVTLLFSSTVVQAHNMILDCWFENSLLLGKVMYSPGNPVRNCTVKRYNLKTDSLLATTTTSDEGAFSFHLENRTPFTVVALDGHGHRTSWSWTGTGAPEEKAHEHPGHSGRISSGKIAAGFAIIIFLFGIVRFLRKHYHES